MGNDTERPDQGRILIEVALQFGATLDLDSLLTVVVERVAAVVRAERALFALVDERGAIERAVVHNLDWAGPGHPLPVSHGVIQKVVQERKPVLLSDAANDETFQRHQSIQLFGLRLIVAVPVLARDRVVGVIYVDSQEKSLGSFGEKVELLTALSRLVGTAVENARLFEEQRYRTMLLAQLVHDFRSPLSVITTNAGVLLEASAGEAAQMAADIEASALRMSQMITATLELSRIDAGATGRAPEDLDVEIAIRSHLRPFAAVARGYHLVLEVAAEAKLPQAVTIPDRLWIILDNLIFNALKHSRSGSAIRVEIGRRDDAGPPEVFDRLADSSACLFRSVSPLVADPEAGFLEISVANQGRPIPRELVPRLFHAYVRGDDNGTGHSLGLGLSIVDQCTRHLGGQVWVRSTEEEGTRFSFTLPTRLQDA